MTRPAVLCRQATLRVFVLALFAWVALFSILFHYHPAAPGTTASLAIARHARLGLVAAVAPVGPLISQASKVELDCPICALGGSQPGITGAPPAEFRPQPALVARGAPPTSPSRWVARIAQPRAPPIVLA